MTRWPGYTADYIEDQPVLFRTKLIQQILKEKEEKNSSNNLKGRK